ncbi:tail fiber assembly protein [Xenorhabdus cabanillasii]|uniref:Tail fiber assembly protein n=1 Tax=Xenorhabdus cabanillasii JM26 TaxID=1427517 RepID=W1JBA6_9GAMM|nr:tail fiber assembly protein [Xenorhabdus cabanillasii]PHM76279.1 tail assembly chaperone [Xenorhabdus cabanillasii JM26]CDL87196.1 conserved hypothetical protein [Xenorhabdus cabanillasii JM26]
MKNYYFDKNKNYQPFTFITEATPGSFPPENAVRTKPPTRTGYWPCMIDTEWQLLPDNRGKTIYNITTQQSVVCQDVVIPDGYTELVPKTPFDHWDGKQWVTDLIAQQAHETQQAEYEKWQLLRAATDKINIYQDAVELGISADGEELLLAKWRRYRVLLNRIDCSAAPDIHWPEQPE